MPKDLTYEISYRPNLRQIGEKNPNNRDNKPIFGPARQRLSERLTSALERGADNAIGVLLGPKGVGRQTIALVAVAAVPRLAHVAVLSAPPRDCTDLVHSLLLYMGLSSADLKPERNAMLNLWSQHMAALVAKNQRPVIIVTDAQKWCCDSLRTLDALSDASTQYGVDIPLILCGETALLRLLHVDVMDAVRQRICLAKTVPAMPVDSLVAWLQAKATEKFATQKGRGAFKISLSRRAGACLHAICAGQPAAAWQIVTRILSDIQPLISTEIRLADIRSAAVTEPRIVVAPINYPCSSATLEPSEGPRVINSARKTRSVKLLSP